MIGIILTGHARFASGLTSSLKLLNGEVEQYAHVDFPAGMDQYVLLENIKNAKNQLSDCDEWIILTDIVGGTPFKMSVLYSMQTESVRVLTGTNLPLLLQMVLSRNAHTNTDELIASSIKEAANSMIEFHAEDYQ